MTLKGMKALAESFRAIADDKKAVEKLASDTRRANPKDTEVCDLADRFETAPDATAVRAICDEVKARTV